MRFGACDKAEAARQRAASVRSRAALPADRSGLQQTEGPRHTGSHVGARERIRNCKDMFRIITIPFDRGQNGFDDTVLNKFLLNKSLTSYRAEFFEDQGEKFWTLLLEYDPVLQKGSKKEEEHLDESQRLLLNRLKAWRKEKAEKDGVPAYIVATNKELVDIVRGAPKSFEALKNIKGFGQGKVSKHGKEIVEIIKGFSGKS